MSRPPVERIAITAPPPRWFHGIAQALFERYRQALVDLGISVFDVPVETFLSPDAGRIATLVSELRAFHPQLAFGLPVGSYALICRLPPTRDGTRPNVFTDVLDIPSICVWDHAPVELADQLLAPHPAGPAASRTGALDALRRVLAHPRLVHWSRDSGQTRIMRALGLLPSQGLITERPPVLPGFEPAEPARDRRSPGRADVAFVGHLYQDGPDYPDAALEDLAERSIGEFVESTGGALWDVLMRHIDAVPAHARERLALDTDQQYFWKFAHQLICHQAQTVVRLRFMGAAGVPVACYGNLQTDSRSVPPNVHAIPSNVAYGPPLARLFARHAITLDALNPGFVEGYSHKQVHGFASGGFMLISRKQDFVDAFGDAGAAVCCASAEEIAAKVDLFLTNPRLRCEVGDAIRATIAARFQLKDVLMRALHAARDCAGAAGAPGTAMAAVSSTLVVDLLEAIRCEPHWPGADVRHEAQGAIVSTAETAWHYAAALPLPPDIQGWREPHLRIRLIVERGRIGIAAMRDGDGALVDEQFVSATSEPVELIVELPHTGASMVIVRNTVDGGSRAVVLRAGLCDRVPRMPDPVHRT